MQSYIDFLLNTVFTNHLLLGLIIYLFILLLVALSLVLFTLRLHQSNEQKSQLWRQLEERWEPLLMEILAQEQWPDSFHKLVQEGEELFFIDFLMRYAEKLSGKSRQAITELAQPYLPQLAARASGGDSEQRARAILTLSTLAPKDYEAEIVAALDDESPLVCMLATRSLADNQATQFTAQILDKTTRFKAWSQSYLISTLVALARQEREILRSHLTESHRPEWIRLIILKALTELNDWQAMPLAVEFLNMDGDRELQAAALQFISRLGHDGLLDLIRKKCHADDFVIRLNAVKALAQLGNEKDQELLEKLIADPSQWIAYQAAFALKKTQNFEALMRIAHSDHSRAALAEQVLYDYQDPQNLAYLCQQASFAKRVPQWFHMLELHKSAQKWKAMVEIFLSENTAPEVSLKMAQSFSHKYPDSIYIKILSEIKEEENTPFHQLLAIRRLNPNMALETLKEKFQQTHNWQLRAEILNLLSQYPQELIQDFFSTIKELLATKDFKDRMSEQTMNTIQTLLATQV